MVRKETVPGKSREVLYIEDSEAEDYRFIEANSRDSLRSKPSIYAIPTSELFRLTDGQDIQEAYLLTERGMVRNLSLLEDIFDRYGSVKVKELKSARTKRFLTDELASIFRKEDFCRLLALREVSE